MPWRLGVNAFIRKPTDPDTLIQMLSGILEKAGAGLLAPSDVKPLKQYDYLEEHNKRLVTKLQKKITDLNNEIAEHKRAEIEILRLNRLYSVISQVNQAVVRATDAQTLLDDVCHIIMEKGEFKLAWVGTPNPETMRVLPVAAAGTLDYVKNISIYTDMRPEGMGPVGSSIPRKNGRSSRTIFSVTLIPNPGTPVLLNLDSMALPLFPSK